MLQLPETNLDQKWQNYLDTWQQEINAIEPHSEKVAQAKAKYENRTGTATFKNIRETLKTMCSGNRRCCYCEDSCADEVEHILPKSLYPKRVFIWKNYLYSCGLCNSKKNNHYAVIVGNEIQPITRKKNDPIVPPPAGKGVFINPRIENPLDSLELDLGDDLDGTFFFRNISITAGSRPEEK